MSRILSASLCAALLSLPIAAWAQAVDQGGGEGGGGFGRDRGFTDNPLKRFPTPFPTTPWFGLGSPQVPSAGNASADSPIARFALRFEELEALLAGEPFEELRLQQVEDINTLLGRTGDTPLR